ncbi:hypothetical protein [Plantactinospora sp. B5E13]|uniref:hypothetical protein n=1 Tax=unclassified Plantactinospora TaxID=2631981 RepID=UPI00325C3D47
MPTYAQLQAETWWGRELTTPELAWLGAELCRRTGRPRGAFGTKGDNNHLRGAHRSQEWILKSRYATSPDVHGADRPDRDPGPAHRRSRLHPPREEDVDDATIDKIATRTKTKVLVDSGIQQLLSRVQQLTVSQAALLDAMGRDPTDEQAIIDGVLSGLGARNLDSVAEALKTAFGDRAAELAAKLGTPAS